jgi:hypothetical protein
MPLSHSQCAVPILSARGETAPLVHLATCAVFNKERIRSQHEQGINPNLSFEGRMDAAAPKSASTSEPISNIGT